MSKGSTKLVIVESPAKAKTIQKYLGDGYEVEASMGHLRDLPHSSLGVDIENNFKPEYVNSKDKTELIAKLRKKAKTAEKVYLATDPDREGEAIAWHLNTLLDLPDGEPRRVTFNEITRKVVQDSIKSPREINMNLVDAQQARRILDRLIGYKLSPLLWKKIYPKLSAGRVQSVATRMVVDKEREVSSFVSEEYWLLDARFVKSDGKSRYTGRFYGTAEGKTELRSEAEADSIIAAVDGGKFRVSRVEHTQKQRSPSPPFITSTLQQEASRRLNMAPRRTMSIAQQLYEGIEISGRGTVGLITYMRTDSLRLSEEALAAAGKFITAHYGREYYNGSPRRFHSGAGAQDAHEAIRPTDITITPEAAGKSLTREQYNLYRLIWGRFTASQMSKAVYDNVEADTESAGYIFRSKNSVMRFPGYTAVYEESRDEENGEEKEIMPELSEGETVSAERIDKEQMFTQPPPRYTEATLIRALEKEGIGRPSTYAPTISTILDHSYVGKDGKYLHPTELGKVVNGLMEERFPDIVDLKFTAHMEADLDKVEGGNVSWPRLVGDYYGNFEKELSDAEKALEGKRLKVPPEVTDEICPLCGKNLVVKKGKFGEFLACPGYPECSYTMPMVVRMPGECPFCGGGLLKRKSRKGFPYYACEKGRDCSYRGIGADGKELIGFITWDIPTKEVCPECGKTLFKLSGKGRRKPFCVNPECSLFVPEDKRGYRKKPASGGDAEQKAEEEEPKKKPAKKTTAKKPSSGSRKKADKS